MRKVCKERMVQFGQAGQARKIRQVTLAEMAKVYG
jgi:fructose-bisphosphate aldolase class II